MMKVYQDGQEFLAQDNEYKNFLKKSVNKFRQSSHQKINSCNIKVPEIIKNSEFVSEKHKRLQKEILKKNYGSTNDKFSKMAKKQRRHMSNYQSTQTIQALNDFEKMNSLVTDVSEKS